MRLEATLLIALLLAATRTHAQDLWMHWPPRAGESTTQAVSEGSATGTRIDLRLERRGESVVALIENPLAGPVEAVVSTERNGRNEDTRMVVPAGARVAALRLPANQPVNVQLRAIPGAPDARPHASEDLLPVPFKGLRIDQATGGAHSHMDDENRDAIDFAAPLGTPITAARAGVVMDVEATQPDHSGASASARTARANFVRVLHEDGTMALYAHLAQGSIGVHRGEQVTAGQVLGRVGNSGYSSAPHLHYVLQVNDGGRLRSLPARLLTPQGLLQLPR